MYIIAFTGYAGAGKTTAAEVLMKHYHYSDWTKIAFADSLKALLLNSGTCTKDQILNKTARPKMQQLGKLMRDHINKDFWVGMLDFRISQLKVYNFPRVFIDDVRYQNEAEYVKKQDGVLIRIVSDRYKSCDHKTIDRNHESETNIEHVQADFSVVNNGTKEELLESLLKVLDNE